MVAGLLSAKKLYKNIWGMAGTGILLSVPIINYVGIRAYASVIPITIILVSLTISSILTWLKVNSSNGLKPDPNLGRDGMVFSIIVLSIIILGLIVLIIVNRKRVNKIEL